MARLARDRAAGVQHPRENFGLANASLAALNAEAIIDCHGCSSVSVDIRGTYSGSQMVQGTVDGTNWTPIPMLPRLGGKYQVQIVNTGAFTGNCAGYERVRVVEFTHTSGVAIVSIVASNAIPESEMFAKVTTDTLSTTGAAGAAVTLSLPAPATNLRHYITYLRISRFATAALTAAATPVTITTTNLPGSLAFNVAADALALGSISVAVEEAITFPWAATSQATATTFVCPATPSVIWRATAGYYVAP